MAEMFPRLFKHSVTREDVQQAEQEAALLSGEAAAAAYDKAEQRRVLLKGEQGEELVFRALEKMPSDWVVFHGVNVVMSPTKERENANELDFVILIPNTGILCLEVKNWSPQKVESHANGGKHAPHVQADIAKNTFVQWLESKNMVKEWFEYRSAAVMTDAYSEEQEKNPLYLCGRHKLNPASLEAFIRSQFVKGTGFRRADMNTIRGLLTAAQIYKVSLGDYLSRMNQVTAPLDSVLPMLEESDGDIGIMGGAGTGKTVMAMREAVRLAAAGKKVLFLCFNKNLVTWVRQNEEIAAQIAAGRLTVNNFHGLCTELCGKPVYHQTLSEEEANTVAEALEREGYDAVFVDEAQDFSQQWWDVTEWALKDKGRWYLFYDERQVLRGQTKLRPTPIRIRLRTNLRNTAEIADYASAIFGKGKEDTLGLHGPKVKVLPPVRDAKERAAVVQKLIDDLLNGELPHIFAPKRNQIVILSPWQAKNDKSCAPYLKRLNVPTHETRTNPELAAARLRDTIFNPNAKEILYETVKAFKGLESDIVILTDIRKPSADPMYGFTPAEFYVAASRARYCLFVVPME